jgi:hypothetical protein
MFFRGCAEAASDATRILKMRVTMTPTVLYHMSVSFSPPYAYVLLPIEAEPLINMSFCPDNALLATPASIEENADPLHCTNDRP